MTTKRSTTVSQLKNDAALRTAFGSMKSSSANAKAADIRNAFYEASDALRNLVELTESAACFDAAKTDEEESFNEALMAEHLKACSALEAFEKLNLGRVL